jgi:hypothetical protein
MAPLPRAGDHKAILENCQKQMLKHSMKGGSSGVWGSCKSLAIYYESRAAPGVVGTPLIWQPHKVWDADEEEVRKGKLQLVKLRCKCTQLPPGCFCIDDFYRRLSVVSPIFIASVPIYRDTRKKSIGRDKPNHGAAAGGPLRRGWSAQPVTQAP